MLSINNSKINNNLSTSKPIKINNKPINTINQNYINPDNIEILGNKDLQDKIDNTYKLDSMCFDPTKFSPPDEWSYRLKKRIRDYDNTSYTYINYLFDNK